MASGNHHHQERPGGFLPPILPSPPASSPSIAPSTLPHPRDHPLKAGGAKESHLIRFVDQRILHIQRRYAKRTEGGFTVGQPVGEEKDDTRGYTSLGEAATELERVVDVVWISGTPSVQIPYLLNLALLLSTYLSGFASPRRLTSVLRPLFSVLGKLDLAFASLIQGRNVETEEPLPGSERKASLMNGTEKVRLKSIVDGSRVRVMEIVTSAYVDDEDEEEGIGITATETETEGEGDGPTRYHSSRADDVDEEMMSDDEPTSWEMAAARVYDRTLVMLGDTIGGTPIGIITED
ncbi:hypothetical protein P152DRAFT_406068 [Eremomyces bilateralis CBS 781.70]|uniref:Meiotic recombination protein DMC1 n=1 Tax=Eremomyces bilateralis CBS 781.70 TaxID=1392243 RepID=A0A6G1FR13_9PEZI|nr:uncharacterized protein P152DRAFT_406068 [Eremomyces bilateralis CBS 781.70]KAF1808121.1 hypothetical protein P152DRAFT_406068 [Eremomyces bilateralis CBS 781.70]